MIFNFYFNRGDGQGPGEERLALLPGF